MWRTYTEQGSLAYSFLDLLVAMYPDDIARALGGLLFLIGTLVGCYNMWMTARPQTQAAMGETDMPVGPAVVRGA